jgi:hypothetical protein
VDTELRTGETSTRTNMRPDSGIIFREGIRGRSVLANRPGATHKKSQKMESPDLGRTIEPVVYSFFDCSMSFATWELGVTGSTRMICRAFKYILSGPWSSKSS